LSGLPSELLLLDALALLCSDPLLQLLLLPVGERGELLLLPVGERGELTAERGELAVLRGELAELRGLGVDARRRRDLGACCAAAPAPPTALSAPASSGAGRGPRAPPPPSRPRASSLMAPQLASPGSSPAAALNLGAQPDDDPELECGPSALHPTARRGLATARVARLRGPAGLA
jgi:hypothetical protein